MFTLKTHVTPPYCKSTEVFGWQSERTGLQLVLIRRQTPAVNGYFGVATEINDNSGCPHTLEHLVFMGSEKWPYKGLLDIVGNNQLSTTNAWTGQDQTVYTLSTAGFEGFSHLLPVYIDHILNPKLEDSACLTEVYNIDGEGQEKGVVFSEMQGIENSSYSLIAERMQQLLFPQGSGYSTNTGGAMRALRVLENQTIREYHAKTYRPQNLAIIITGDVTPEELLEIVEPIDKELPSKDPSLPRPFVDSKDPILPLTENVCEKIEFPEKDEEYGEAQTGWIGPDSLDVVGNTALQIVSAYFTQSMVGKFELELLNVTDPLGTDASFYTDDYLKTIINLYFCGIPTEKLAEFDATVMATIARHADEAVLDLPFMQDCVRRRRDKFVLDVESDPSTFACSMALDAFLYGNPDGSTLTRDLESLDEFDLLEKWTASQWVEFIKHYFIKNKHVTVLGYPSAAAYSKLKAEKKARLREIKETYDLDKQQELLNDAIAANEKPIPIEVMGEFATPDVNKIKLISTTPASTHSEVDTKLQKLIKLDTPSEFGLRINFESYDSEFVTIKVYLSSRPIEKGLLPYIDVILTELFSMPMCLDDGTIVSYKDVGTSIKRDTLGCSISTNSLLQELVMIDIRVPSKNYAKAVQWIERAIFNVIYDEERLKIFIAKHLSNLAEAKRDGPSVLTASIYENTLLDRSLRRQSECLITEEFFQSAQDNIKRVREDMDRLSKQLFCPENFKILVFGDVARLAAPVSTWANLNLRLKSRMISKEPLSVPFSHMVASSLGRQPCNVAQIVECASTESSHLAVISKGLVDFFDKDVPALTVLNAYLCMTEGPLWKEVRGPGLAYGTRIYHKSDTGHMICSFSRASDPIQAYQVTKRMVLDYASGTTHFTDSLLEGAILSLASALALDQSTHESAVIQKYFDNELRQRGPDYVRSLITKSRDVTKTDLMSALVKYVVPLFSLETSAVFVVCHPTDAGPIDTFFAKQGYETKHKTVTVSDDDDEDDEDDDDDDDDESSDQGTGSIEDDSSSEGECSDASSSDSSI